MLITRIAWDRAAGSRAPAIRFGKIDELVRKDGEFFVGRFGLPRRD
jgi:hypothetical protein